MVNLVNAALDTILTYFIQSSIENQSQQCYLIKMDFSRSIAVSKNVAQSNLRLNRIIKC